MGKNSPKPHGMLMTSAKFFTQKVSAFFYFLRRTGGNLC